MYALVMLLVIVGDLAVRSSLRRPSRGPLVGVAAVAAALAFSHYWTIFVLAAAGLVACDGEPAAPKPGDAFTLKLHERATLDAIHTSVRFLEVSEDSRCPSRVQCVWAGNGAVVLEVAPADADAKEDTLHTNPESGPSGVVLAGYERRDDDRPALAVAAKDVADRADAQMIEILTHVGVR